MIASAGNGKDDKDEGIDACTLSPASVKNVYVIQKLCYCHSNTDLVSHSVTVAASDRKDNFADFSNFGRCVNIIAPV